ncbi:rhodanese-like/PpiC domain-containing protein 12, chloroplastic isoform X2 [Populus nigra]|uniref:rhodanese-like/PpiC domain-containing protein 12, chloroplastic isoform X2 n=1 Tax=Populus nigra TaxID=3691 RepID=UPI002B26E090|nr:rhodanese-like/PpiC domain-containing protein 12, chloroplastic isoform X2 [Populus nigra]
MLRASHIPPVATPALSALKISLIPALSLSSSLPHLYKLSTFAPLHNFLPKTAPPNPSPISFKRFLLMLGHHPCPKASFSSGSGTGGGRELLVQHLLVKEDDLKLLLELQQRISGGGEDLSDLAVEYSLCPSKEEGGMLGWVRKGQMVPEFEEAAFSAPLNKVVRCKTKFGWHLLQVISEREESLLGEIQADELHVKIQDPTFAKEAQLIDVREPDEVKIWLRGREAALTISPCWVHDNMAKASLPGFEVLPLRQFGSWGPEVTTKFDPEKDTYVMCHRGMRSLQVAKWLQSQGFKRVFNVSGGIHAYAVRVDPSIPTY